jgi:hypothetical protein
MSGAPTGNQNAKKGRDWTQAIRKALAHYSGEGATKGMEMLAAKMVEAASNGDPWALKEIGDRIEGKPVQAIEGTGNDGEIPITFTVKYVGNNSSG